MCEKINTGHYFNGLESSSDKAKTMVQFHHVLPITECRYDYIIKTNHDIFCRFFHQGVAKLGIALVLEASDRWFKSNHPDQNFCSLMYK